MSCDEIQESLSLYADDGLTLEERSDCYGIWKYVPCVALTSSNSELFAAG